MIDFVRTDLVLDLVLGDCFNVRTDPGSAGNEAMVNAFRSGAYTMAQIADYFSVYYMH
jgi:hypothetical protein